MDLTEMKQEALKIRDMYNTLHVRRSEPTWSTHDYALGFTVDVGDLARLVQEYQGLRGGRDDLQKRIEHELSDCLWSILVLADELSIDLTKAFDNTMSELTEDLQGRLSE